MKKVLWTLLFLGVTAGLALLFPAWAGTKDTAPTGMFILRVWNGDKEAAVGAWLRGRAAAYEKETGTRVYVRAAGAEDTAPASIKNSGIAPDVLVAPDGDTVVALRGYALFVRDDEARLDTPAPTGALFFRPSPTPGPRPTQAPWPEEDAFSAVLSPRELMDALPGTVLSLRPDQELAQGKASAALLTAGQAAQLAVGWRAYALPEGRGLLPVAAAAYSGPGEAFLAFLQRDDSQTALRACGLFSPFLSLYGPGDAVRYLIDSSKI